MAVVLEASKMREDKPEIKPEWRLCFVEVTGYMPEEWRKVLGRGFEWYVYNASTVTHLCEATPSYRLVPVRVEFERGYEDGAEELRALGFDSMTEVEGEMEATYMHCSDVERLKHTTVPQPDEEDSEEQQEASVVEYVSANCGAWSAFGD